MLKTMVTMALTACLAIAAQARSAPPDRPPGQTAEQYYALNVEKNTAPMERSAQVTRYRLNKMNDQVISKVNRWTWAGRTQMVRRLRC